MDTIDWRLKRDRVYAFFRNLGVFYIAESYQPFKLLKVIVAEDYELDRPVNIWGQSEISLKIIDTPFRQSPHTTGTIGSDGMLFNHKRRYGMGRWFARNDWKYEFTNVNPTFYNAGNEEVRLIPQQVSLITLKINAVPTNGLINIDDGVTTSKMWYD